MWHYLHPRGSIVTFRMPASPVVPNTAAPRRRFELRTSGRNVFSFPTSFPVASAAITGACSGSFALSGVSVATLPDAGASSGSVVLTGSATGTLTVSGASSGSFSLSGSADGTVAQSGWGSVGVFTLSGDIQAALVVGGASAGSLALSGGATAGVQVTAGSDGTLSLSGTATAQVTQPGGGVADPSAVWAFVLPNGKTAGDTLAEVHAWLGELRLIHGLVPGVPLHVSPSLRSAGDIQQQFSEQGNTITATRV